MGKEKENLKICLQIVPPFLEGILIEERHWLRLFGSRNRENCFLENKNKNKKIIIITNKSIVHKIMDPLPIILGKNIKDLSCG